MKVKVKVKLVYEAKIHKGKRQGFTPIEIATYIK